VKTIYEASNAVEAHMLQDLLQQEGITTYMRGAHLQGAVGELPAAGLVRLEADEADYAAAREVIQRWESVQPAEVSTRSQAPGPAKGWRYFLAGLLLGGLLIYISFRLPAAENGNDHNRDGVVDEKWTYSLNGTLLKYEMDRNLDGKIDFRGGYDYRGLMDKAESDDNFDGVFESRTRYQASNAQLSEVDTDADGYPDLRWLYKHGVLTTAEYMDPATGRVLRLEQLSLGKLVSADIDTDKDGVLDTRLIYDKLGAVVATEQIR